MCTSLCSTHMAGRVAACRTNTAHMQLFHWTDWEATLSMFGQHPTCFSNTHTHFPDPQRHLCTTAKTSHLISSHRRKQRVWPDRNLYHLQHGGKLLMLTADTLLPTVTQRLPPAKSSHTHFLKSTRRNGGRCLSSLPVSTSLPADLSVLTSSCLWIIMLLPIPPSIPPSLPSSLPSSSPLLSPPSLCITLQCYSTLLSRYTACHQLADRGRKGKLTQDTELSVLQLMPHFHTGKQKSIK